MYKLSIFFYPPLETYESKFQQDWQTFMSLAEKMPKLRRETVSEVQKFVFGSQGHRYARIHELYFDTRADLDAALNSDAGQAAGQWLHEFTKRRFTLLIAEHKEAPPEEFIKPDPNP